jgi:hypothetical protein
MVEKRVEVEINGKILRVAEHMVPDLMKFGASVTKRTIKEPPKELLSMKPKEIILPEPTVELEPVLNEVPAPELKPKRVRTKNVRT